MSENIDFEFIKNAAFPKGEQGFEILTNMNENHKSLTTWGFEHIKFGDKILDIGCGGGAALNLASKLNLNATLCGCDVSNVSIELSKEKNKELIENGRLKLIECGVSNLAYKDCEFDSVYSIESLYFWPNQKEDLKEVFRVIKPNGMFMTALEMVGGEMSERSSAIAEHLDMNCPSKDELQFLLENAGFKDVKVYHNKENSWLCAIGFKK